MELRAKRNLRVVKYFKIQFFLLLTQFTSLQTFKRLNSCSKKLSYLWLRLITGIFNKCTSIVKKYSILSLRYCHKIQTRFSNISSIVNKYIWEPYIKDDAECELNCKPIGMKYFATLNNTVIDGTMCFRPAEYYRYNYQEGAVCVNGICKVSEERLGLFPH
ncbi:thrombospondin type-1 domain-containing protein 4-like [Glossina fuscipes fuscipes]